ncbi:MAG: diacylglycerol/polyprenol kinase family protein [Acidiferrobacterales bacterium]
MIHPAIAIASVLALLLLLMLGLTAAQSRNAIHPELARKGLHLVMGSVALGFPWLFNEPGPVWVLAVLATLTLLASRYTRLVRERVGGAIHCVKRHSYGDLCFPFSIALLFQLAGDDFLLYILPMFILTVGDALAALVGVFHGRIRYRCPDGNKTVEGSLSLFAVAFNSILVPLAWYADMNLVLALFVALNTAVLVTLVEAVAWRGLDNFLIPISTFFLLRHFLQQDTLLLLAYFMTLICVAAILVYVYLLPRVRVYFSKFNHFAVVTLMLGMTNFMAIGS